MGFNSFLLTEHKIYVDSCLLVSKNKKLTDGTSHHMCHTAPILFLSWSTFFYCQGVYSVCTVCTCRHLSLLEKNAG